MKGKTVIYYIIIMLVWSFLGCNPTSPEQHSNISNDTHFEEGNFLSELAYYQNNNIVRFLYENKVVKRGDFIGFLSAKNQDGADFRKLVNKTLAALSIASNGYQLKAPIINKDVVNEDFYFVAVPAHFSSNLDMTFYPYFIHCEEAQLAMNKSPEYQSHFISLFGTNLTQVNVNEDTVVKDGTTAFLGGSAARPDTKKIMISPCPWASAQDNQATPHIALYVKKLEDNKLEQRIQSLWFTIGNMATKLFNGTTLRDSNGVANNDKGLFLNTHGHGVSYLHFRVELNSSYYGGVEFLTTPQESVQYYKKVFH